MACHFPEKSLTVWGCASEAGMQVNLLENNLFKAHSRNP